MKNCLLEVFAFAFVFFFASDESQSHNPKGTSWTKVAKVSTQGGREKHTHYGLLGRPGVEVRVVCSETFVFFRLE